ncbi:MAG: MFS transporter [Burkholderiaceae bacterium]|nr:MFS transporter [Burkholderiaceae bacterium]
MLSSAALSRYGALSLPLAMAMLPVYMVAPKFYADTLGVSLSALGICLLLVRLFDTVQDPLIGRWVDTLSRYRHGWSILILGASFLLALGFIALFIPAVTGEMPLLIWLSLSLVVVYTAHSLINICYLAWGARLTDDVAGRARVTAWREAIGVIGVVLASVLPAYWASTQGASTGYAWFAYCFVAVLLVTTFITLKFAPRPAQVALPSHSNWKVPLANATVRRLYVFYFLNATSVALPATLILFYVDDVLQTPDLTGLFLAVYFLSGLCTLPLWVKFADLVTKARAWAFGAVMASAALVWAATLGQGDVIAYATICAVAGAALGADLALPPAMLADAIPPQQRSSTGLYFGVWALIAKFSLAIAAGVSLPTLAWLGYQPGNPMTAATLPLWYAILPITFKLGALIVIKPWCLSHSFVTS